MADSSVPTSGNWTLPKPLTLSRFDVELWIGMVRDGVTAARTEGAATSFGILTALLGYLEEALEPDATSSSTPMKPSSRPVSGLANPMDPSWDRDYDENHSAVWREANASLSADQTEAAREGIEQDNAPIQRAGSSWEPQ